MWGQRPSLGPTAFGRQLPWECGCCTWLPAPLQGRGPLCSRLGWGCSRCALGHLHPLQLLNLYLLLCLKLHEPGGEETQATLRRGPAVEPSKGGGRGGPEEAVPVSGSHGPGPPGGSRLADPARPGHRRGPTSPGLQVQPPS